MYDVEATGIYGELFYYCQTAGQEMFGYLAKKMEQMRLSNMLYTHFQRLDIAVCETHMS